MSRSGAPAWKRPPFLTESSRSATDPADAEAIVAAEDDRIRHAFLRKEPTTVERTLRWIESSAEAWRTSGQDRLLAIRPAGSEALLGVIGLKFSPRGTLLDRWLAPDHRHQGYGRRAVTLALEYLFTELRCYWVDVEVRPDNEASARLAVSLGFEPSQLRAMPDMTPIHRYRLFRARWQEAKGGRGHDAH